MWSVILLSGNNFFHTWNLLQIGYGLLEWRPGTRPCKRRKYNLFFNKKSSASVIRCFIKPPVVETQASRLPSFKMLCFTDGLDTRPANHHNITSFPAVLFSSPEILLRKVFLFYEDHPTLQSGREYQLRQHDLPSWLHCQNQAVPWHSTWLF